MDMKSYIDINFDFRTDTPRDKDPDALSPTLRRYHKLLWSKPLPNGAVFHLDDTNPKIYLHHQSELGEFFLSSDSAIHTFSKWKRTAHIIEQLNLNEIEAFRKLSYSMGGMIIFPANKVDGKNTINMARGIDRKISDRIDLTLECIKRYYNHEPSPLSETLTRYADFFALFVDFQGYVKFFLMQDLVSEDFSTIKFFMPFEEFKSPAFPQTIDAYLSYKKLVTEFVMMRNQRILESTILT